MNRKIIQKTAGHRHGPITRLMSPGDIGQIIKPFIFLDYVDAPAGAGPNFGFHPHSGIATLTFPLSFDIQHETSSGQIDTVERGGIEWVVTGKGIWHRAKPLNGETMQAFQTWFSLPPSHETSEPSAMFIQPKYVPVSGNVKILLGSYLGMQSPIPAPFDISYLWITLKDGETFTYQPPEKHQVAWIFSQKGTLETGGEQLIRELAVFEDGNGELKMTAKGNSAFLLGSAVKHNYDLVMGPYSVHTDRTALEEGFRNINAIRETIQ